MNRSTWGATGAMALLALAAGCASPPTVEKYVPMAEGSTWTSQFRNSGSYSTAPPEVQVRITQVMWKGQQHIGLQGPAGTTVALPNSGRWVAIVAPDGKPLQSWDPPIGYDWPLEVGKSWTRNVKFTNYVANQVIDVEARTVVEAYEEVRVPAGTFKAYRIRTTDNVGNDNTNWFNPEFGIFVKQSLRRTEKSASGPGTREGELKAVTVAR